MERVKIPGVDRAFFEEQAKLTMFVGPNAIPEVVALRPNNARCRKTYNSQRSTGLRCDP